MKWLLSILFVFGSLLAGCESLYFPWPNLVGALFILLFAALSRHLKEECNDNV